jgi:hypothetical protein
MFGLSQERVYSSMDHRRQERVSEAAIKSGQPELRPHCRNCGKPIRRRGRTVYIVDQIKPDQIDDRSKRYVVGSARGLADLERFTKMHILSVKPAYQKRDQIASFTEWDGVTFADPYFCTNNCAHEFAYWVMRTNPNMATHAYRDAVAKLSEGAPATNAHDR